MRQFISTLTIFVVLLTSIIACEDKTLVDTLPTPTPAILHTPFPKEEHNSKHLIAVGMGFRVIGWSPDGKWLVYWQLDGQNEETTVDIVQLVIHNVETHKTCSIDNPIVGKSPFKQNTSTQINDWYQNNQFDLAFKKVRMSYSVQTKSTADGYDEWVTRLSPCTSDPTVVQATHFRDYREPPTTITMRTYSPDNRIEARLVAESVSHPRNTTHLNYEATVSFIDIKTNSSLGSYRFKSTRPNFDERIRLSKWINNEQYMVSTADTIGPVVLATNGDVDFQLKSMLRESGVDYEPDYTEYSLTSQHFFHQASNEHLFYIQTSRSVAGQIWGYTDGAIITLNQADILHLPRAFHHKAELILDGGAILLRPIFRGDDWSIVTLNSDGAPSGLVKLTNAAALSSDKRHFAVTSSDDPTLNIVKLLSIEDRSVERDWALPRGSTRVTNHWQPLGNLLPAVVNLENSSSAMLYLLEHSKK